MGQHFPDYDRMLPIKQSALNSLRLYIPSIGSYTNSSTWAIAVRENGFYIPKTTPFRHIPLIHLVHLVVLTPF